MGHRGAVLGDGNQYHKIAAASGVANPDLIHPGQVLTIPDLTDAEAAARFHERTGPPFFVANRWR